MYVPKILGDKGFASMDWMNVSVNVHLFVILNMQMLVKLGQFVYLKKNCSWVFLCRQYYFLYRAMAKSVGGKCWLSLTVFAKQHSTLTRAAMTIVGGVTSGSSLVLCVYSEMDGWMDARI